MEIEYDLMRLVSFGFNLRFPEKGFHRNTAKECLFSVPSLFLQKDKSKTCNLAKFIQFIDVCLQPARNRL